MFLNMFNNIVCMFVSFTSSKLINVYVHVMCIYSCVSSHVHCPVVVFAIQRNTED